jgi:hypothetical protein
MIWYSESCVRLFHFDISRAMFSTISHFPQDSLCLGLSEKYECSRFCSGQSTQDVDGTTEFQKRIDSKELEKR